MHRDKTTVRILLILSVVHLAVASPVMVRQRSLDVDEDVTRASEKRGNSDDTPQDLYPVPQMGNELPTTSGILQSRNDLPPESGTAQLHDLPPPSYSSDGGSVYGGEPLYSPQDSPVHPLHGGLRNADWAHPPLDWAQPLYMPQGNPVHPLHDGLRDEDWAQPLYTPQGSPVHPLHDGLRNAEGAPPAHELETPPPHALETEARKGLSKEAKNDLKKAGIFAVVIAGSLALIVGSNEWHRDSATQNSTQKPQPSNVVGRDVSTHPRLPEKPVSRAFANLRDEDSRLLSILTRRVLERLD